LLQGERLGNNFGDAASACQSAQCSSTLLPGAPPGDRFATAARRLFARRQKTPRSSNAQGRGPKAKAEVIGPAVGVDVGAVAVDGIGIAVRG